MIFTFVGLSLLWLAGFQICRIFDAGMDHQIDGWIEAGAGFFIATALLILLLSNVPTSLNIASWAAVFASTLVALPLFCAFMRAKFIGIRGFNLTLLRAHLPHILIITLISAHLALVLSNNLSRDIYPWDAITTWMYRAKVWVLNNRLLDFQAVNQWLQSGGEGYGLHAAHYPTSISAVAAFASALSGGWSDQAASLPWFFATLAISSLMFGLCRQSGWGILPSLIGTYGLISIPLASMHGALAGYADLWMLGTSGMGLAALLMREAQPEKGLLYVGTALLLIGCFIKTEGWIWLGLGLLFVSLLALWRHYRFKALAGCVAMVLLCIALESVRLGPFGIWGIHDGAIHVGQLGSYALRRYNPLHAYFEMIFTRGNFHLLGLFYLTALVVLTLRNARASGIHWLMGGLIASSQGVIFGLSSYSLYAETGTSINRLMLHFLPVFVLTGMAGLRSLCDFIVHSEPARASEIKTLFTRVTASAAAAVLLSAIAAAVLIDKSLNIESTSKGFYAAEELVPVLGHLKQINHGRQQFTHTPGPVAVAKVQLANPGAIQARYVVTNAHMTKPEAISFYWITADNPQVQSYSLDISGPTIIDMRSIAAYWKKPITEMGYLVDAQSLEDAQLGDLQVTDVLMPTALSAVLNHWTTPDVISQRSINMVDGHLPSPISWGRWQSTTLILVLLCSLIFAVIAKSAAPHAAGGFIAVAAMLWLASDLLSLRQLTTATAQLEEGKMSASRQLNADVGATLTELTDTMSNWARPEAGIISIALDKSADFHAQAVPLRLAPRSVVTINLRTAARQSMNWQGHFIIFSDDQSALQTALERLGVGTHTRITARGKDFMVLSPNKS